MSQGLEQALGTGFLKLLWVKNLRGQPGLALGTGELGTVTTSGRPTSRLHPESRPQGSVTQGSKCVGPEPGAGLAKFREAPRGEV